jgi:hypothetical protein
MKGDLLLLVVEIHSAGRAEFLTGPALAFFEIDTVITVDHILQRNGLRVVNIDGLSLHEALVVFAVHLFRAFFRTGSASDAFLKVHETGVLEDVDLEVSLFSADIQYFT